MDTLKIDGSFIRDVTTNVVSQSVVAAIAEVARVMNLETVAEYVQDQAAMDLLQTLNISYAQGYVVGAAEPLAGADRRDKRGRVRAETPGHAGRRLTGPAGHPENRQESLNDNRHGTVWSAPGTAAAHCERHAATGFRPSGQDHGKAWRRARLSRIRSATVGAALNDAAAVRRGVTV